LRAACPCRAPALAPPGPNCDRRPGRRGRRRRSDSRAGRNVTGTRREQSVSDPAWADGRRFGPGCPAHQETPGHWAWGDMVRVERVKGIEPSLSAWELASGLVSWLVDLAFWLVARVGRLSVGYLSCS